MQKFLIVSVVGFGLGVLVSIAVSTNLILHTLKEIQSQQKSWQAWDMRVNE